MEFNSIDQVLQESKGGPYIYEVRCFVHLAVERKWRQYMDENHIPDVLKTGFFISAKILKLHKHFDEETIDPSMWQAYFVQYRLEGVDKFEEYQKKSAKPLQQEHSELFGKAVKAKRFFYKEEKLS